MANSSVPFIIPVDNPNAESNGPKAQAAVWALTAIAAIFMSLRMFVKIKRHRATWWDDHVLIASWICLFLVAVFLSINVSAGFGRHFTDVDPSKFSDIGLRGFVLGTFTILGAVWSKTSFAITLLRISSPALKIVLWIIMISMNVFMILAAIIQWVQCTPLMKSMDSTIPGTCWPPEINLGISMAAAAYSAVMDLILAFLPWFILINLQIKLKEKIGIALCMSMGVFAAATALVKCVKLKALTSADFLFDGGDLITWAAAETAVTIIAASIPVLRTLIREVSSARRTGNYFRSTSNDEVARKSRTHRAGMNTITVTALGKQSNPSQDADSDKSILEGYGGGKIMKTDEVRVIYGDKGDHGSLVYEMDRMDRNHRPRNMKPSSRLPSL